ncbi:MAG TPA: nuclear transport factor 2 family protein [Solirubrobacteraceae bacterium]|nr:nuclear transport factor 2 family protein [Solirubrobacteraceae bacterium]
MNAAAAFRTAVERQDIEAARELLAPDIVFHSPVTFHPFLGRDTVMGLLSLVAQTFEDFRYTDELAMDGGHALIFKASVAGRELEGIDLLRFDEQGLIADFTVMLRPLSGLVPFAQIMGEKAAAAGVDTTRS